MTKAEMEAHSREYNTCLAFARTAAAGGYFRKAVEYGLAAWDHIDGMIQCARRYGGRETVSVDAIELVLTYAPALLDFISLSTLGNLLKTYKRIERGSTDDLAERLESATREMWEAHGLFHYLEQHPDVDRQQLLADVGADHKRSLRTLEHWERMGLLQQTRKNSSIRVALSTRLGAVCYAKCPRCGDVSEAPKAMFLEPLKCPQCRHTSAFVLIKSKGRGQLGK
jgi:hypothetical protein